MLFFFEKSLFEHESEIATKIEKISYFGLTGYEFQ